MCPQGKPSASKLRVLVDECVDDEHGVVVGVVVAVQTACLPGNLLGFGSELLSSKYCIFSLTRDDDDRDVGLLVLVVVVVGVVVVVDDDDSDDNNCSPGPALGFLNFIFISLKSPFSEDLSPDDDEDDEEVLETASVGQAEPPWSPWCSP